MKCHGGELAGTRTPSEAAALLHEQCMQWAAEEKHLFAAAPHSQAHLSKQHQSNK